MFVEVRRGRPEDAPTLARLRWRWQSEDAPAREADRAAFLEYFTDWMTDHLASHVPFVAEVDGRIAGMAWLMLADRVPSPPQMYRRTGDVQSVYVIPELRNGGVGAALIGAILAEARDRELEHVTVHSAEGAVPFYLRCGFREDANWLQWRALPDHNGPPTHRS